MVTDPAFSMLRFVGAAVAVVLGIACSSSAPSDLPQDPPRDPPRACTQIACEDGLKLDLEPSSGWPAGDYRFLIGSDDVRVTCRGSLPLPACSAGRSVTCEPAVVTVVESGCALPASAHGFPQISFDSMLRPKSVRVSIVRSQGGVDSEVASAELSPEFRTVEPNGPGCPPVCTQAQGRVPVRF